MRRTTRVISVFVFSTILGLGACDRSGGEAAGPAEDAAASADPKVITGYSAEKVAASTWVIHGPLELPNVRNKGFMNNPAFITTPGGVVIVDPGSSVYTGNMLLREIRKVTDAPVIAIFNSHVHGDHWLGNDAFDDAYPEAAIYGHAKMIERIEAGAGQEWIDLLSSLTEGATDGTGVVKPDQAAAHDDNYTIGGHDFQIIDTGKAHTDTDIMVLYKQDNVLFTGDNAGNRRILRVDHGSFKGNADALQAGLDLDPAVVVPGHGKTGGTEILEAYRVYMETLYNLVAEGYEEDMSDFEMKPKIEAALADYRDWAGFEEELGKHISNAYLEIEAADF